MTQTNNQFQNLNHLRGLIWTGAGVLLLLPLLAMQFTDEVSWDVVDFVIFGMMLAIAAFAFDFVLKKIGHSAYRWGSSFAIAAAFLLIWMSGAVGIIGAENNVANLMFVAVLAVALLGSLVVRFEARGMSRVMLVTGALQALAGGIGFVLESNANHSAWPFEIVYLTIFFVALWLISAWFFSKAADVQ